MRFFVHTFGCQMNAHDSDRIRETLVDAGFEESPHEDAADVIVFNTCSVREKAEQKLRSEMGKLAPRKLLEPDLVLVIAGCVAQQEGDQLLKQIPHCDVIVGPDNIPELPMLVIDHRAGGPRMARAVFDVDAPRFLQARFGSATRAPASAFVTTMKGCDERCSFCIVPYTRGPERYRPAREIIDEIGGYLAAGTREIVLLGQTVDSFRDPELPAPESDDADETQFPHLLRAIAAAHGSRGLARLRYTSPHPRHTTPSLVRAHAELAVLARHVHLPSQSGSDRMLKRMIRRYTRAEYVKRAKALQAARPGLTMSTDIIVGFPGETRADFEATLDMVREVGFVSLFGFKYSERPHTPSLKMKDDVTEAEKTERLLELFALAESQTRAHLDALVGTDQIVLIEGKSKNEGRKENNDTAPRARDQQLVQGRSDRNEIVHVTLPASVHAEGTLLPVRITRAFRHSLVGEAHESAVGALPGRAAAPDVSPARSRHLPIAPLA